MKPTETETTADIQILSESGKPLSVYDGGMGPLWVYRESLGIVGIVRASTFEDAYSIVEDEFMSEADQTWEEIAKDCDCANPDDLMDNAQFQEAYGFRPNGPNGRDTMKHGIYSHDLNGESLDLLTPKLMKHLGLTLVPAPAPESATR
jgi:hypothetical protein